MESGNHENCVKMIRPAEKIRKKTKKIGSFFLFCFSCISAAAAAVAAAAKKTTGRRTLSILWSNKDCAPGGESGHLRVTVQFLIESILVCCSVYCVRRSILNLSISLHRPPLSLSLQDAHKRTRARAFPDAYLGAGKGQDEKKRKKIFV